METQLWAAKMGEKWADFLVMRGTEITELRVSGSKIFLKKKVTKFLEAIAAGQAPDDAGAKVVNRIDARQIRQVELGPGNDTIKFFPEDPAGKNLKFLPDKIKADQLWEAIRPATGKDFEPAQVEIGAVEAVLPSTLLAVVVGVFWGVTYHTAGEIASGKAVEATGRRRGTQQLLIWVAETLGTTGLVAAGVLLLLLIGGNAIRRLKFRPVKTVWLPAGPIAAS